MATCQACGGNTNDREHMSTAGQTLQCSEAFLREHVKVIAVGMPSEKCPHGARWTTCPHKHPGPGKD